jgi:hypothetical protein
VEIFAMSAPDILDVAKPGPKVETRAGPFDWYRNINKQERRTFWSCKIGYGLDGMDTQMRGSGQGFCYNIGRALAAFFPLLIGLLSQKVPLSMGIGAFAAVSYGVVILAALSLPETRGKQLDAQ